MREQSEQFDQVLDNHFEEQDFRFYKEMMTYIKNYYVISNAELSFHILEKFDERIFLIADNFLTEIFEFRQWQCKGILLQHLHNAVILQLDRLRSISKPPVLQLEKLVMILSDLLLNPVL